MGDKIKKTYKALLKGAKTGLSGDALFQFIHDEYPKATSKRIVKAALLALSDPHVKDEATLNAIYALAIKHRLDPASPEDAEDEPQTFTKAPRADALENDPESQVLDATSDA